MWQACPICKGSGYTPALFGTMNRCRTCLTSGVINELTARPPQHFIDQEEIRRDVKGIDMAEHDVNQLTLPFTTKE